MSLTKASYVLVGLLLLSGLLLLLTSCGGGGNGGGGGVDYDYGISLTPGKTSVAPGETLNLNFKYDAPATNAGVTWSLGCVQADCGSVSAAGFYTAPAKVDAQIPVGIRATSNDKPTSSYYVQIWVTGPIVVQLTPDWPIALTVGMTQQFSATVNSPDTQIIWQVNGITGGNATIGTISASGLYTAPASVPDPDTVTVSAVAHADQTASASKQVTITPPQPVVVEISPRDQTVGTGGTLQFTATVLHTNDTAVAWQVNGVAGGNATVGTISAAGLFTAPATVPDPALETIKAVSHADPTKSDSTFVTIVGSNNSKLQGPYAFVLSGPDPNGEMVGSAGSILADGNGKLTGLLDLNSTAAPNPTTVQFTGTYNVGPDNRGTMSLIMSSTVTFSFRLNASGTSAKLIQFDKSGIRAVGVMEQQTAGDFALSKFKGYYAFSAHGSTASGERTVAIGKFSADGAGNLTAASFDAKEAYEDLVTVSNVTGSATLSNTTYGRGTFTLVQSTSNLMHFAYYMVNANESLFVSTDPMTLDVPLFVGRIVLQTGAPFSNASLSGNGVLSLAGIATASGTASFEATGLWTATSSTHTLAGVLDLNVGGVVGTNQPYTASYSIDASGRGTMTSSMLAPMVFYMIAPNKAFVMQSSGDEELLGLAEPQVAGPFANTTFSGDYSIGPICMPLPGADISQGSLVADGSGNFTAIESVNGVTLSTQTFEGTYSVAGNGRTVLTIISPEMFHYVAYAVSSTRFVGMSIEPGDSAALLTALDQ